MKEKKAKGYVDAYAKTHRRFGEIPAPEDMSQEWLEVRKLWNDRSANAKRVWDLLSLDNFMKECGLTHPLSDDLIIKLVDDWRKAVDDSIVKNLNSQTLPIFIKLILDNPNSAVVQELVQANRLAFSSANGVKSGITRKGNALAKPQRVMAAREDLIRNGTPPRETSALLAKRFSVTPQQIRKVVKMQTENK